jgi:hypothetical protein
MTPARKPGKYPLYPWEEGHPDFHLWQRDYDEFRPSSPVAGEVHFLGAGHFKGLAIIHGLPILVGIFPSRREACAAIVEAHGGRPS